jgi:hypothetical protein
MPSKFEEPIWDPLAQQERRLERTRQGTRGVVCYRLGPHGNWFTSQAQAAETFEPEVIRLRDGRSFDVALLRQGITRPKNHQVTVRDKRKAPPKKSTTSWEEYLARLRDIS